MIKKLSVKNFKSIKEMEIDCRKINLFIGEPNAGKSNILEILNLLSWFTYGNTSLTEYVRYQNFQDLFCDGEFIDKSVDIKIDVREEANQLIGVDTKIVLQGNRFLATFTERLSGNRTGNIRRRVLDYSGKSHGGGDTIIYFRFIRPYIFVKQSKFESWESSFLMPPHGSNMFALVMGNKKIRELMSQFFSDFDLKLVLKPQEMTFEFLKPGQDIVFTYPYILTPDTLQRMVFYTIAMESNENCTLVFEEPESHSFPSDTHRFGKKIAFDKTNQYFIATHDPYLLLAILEKAPKDDVNVFITYARDYQTKVKCLNDDEISELMTYDPFGNLDYLIGDMDSVAEETEE